MGWKSFWQGIFQNLVATVIVIGGGAVLAVLRATHSYWAEPALYGFLAMTALAVLIFALTGRPLLSKKLPQTTVDNVEDNIRTWLDYFGLGVKKVVDPETHFLFLVTPRSGLGMYIARFKSRDRYIAFGANIDIAPEHQVILKALPKEKSGRIAEELSLELAKTGVGYHLTVETDGTLTKISLQRNTPITSNLTQDAFIGYVDQLESNGHVAVEAVRLALDDAKRQLPAS